MRCENSDYHLKEYRHAQQLSLLSLLFFLLLIMKSKHLTSNHLLFTTLCASYFTYEISFKLNKYLARCILLYLFYRSNNQVLERKKLLGETGEVLKETQFSVSNLMLFQTYR